MSQYDNILSKLSAFPPWSPQKESSLLEPFTYVTSNPGKEIRGQLIDAFNLWLEVPAPKLAVISRLIYGIPQTINTANYVFFLAYKELFALREDSSESGLANMGLDAIVTEELLSLHRGQGLELFWRDSLQCPTEEEYISMVNNNYIPLVNLIGIYFQIRDDLMNLESTEYTQNKGFAEDLTEGKFSFPVVHGIHADTTNRQVL
ncbi:hypothetical protein C0991_007935, partial [Blastosporella zonata]